MWLLVEVMSHIKKNKKKNFERSIFDEITYLKEKSKGHVKDAKEVFGICLLISYSTPYEILNLILIS